MVKMVEGEFILSRTEFSKWVLFLTTYYLQIVLWKKISVTLGIAPGVTYFHLTVY